jgi:adenylate cyclase
MTAESSASGPEPDATDVPEVSRRLADELGLGPDDRELAAALLRLGVSADGIRRAAARGRLEDAIYEEVLDPEREARTVSPREVEARGGLTVADTQAVLRALGLPAPAADDAYFTPAEAEVFVELDRLSDLWPTDVRLEVSRVYGRALTRVAQTEVHAFRARAEPLLREITSSPLDALAAVRQAFGWLLPLGDPILLGVHRRKVEHELTQAVVWEVESEAERPVPGSREVSLLFCDLTGFTTYADAYGDAAAIEVIERFADRVDTLRGERSRFVKRLGDGYMLAYPEPQEAVAAALRIGASMREVEAVGIHAGVHHGMAVFRDGDYFGRAVNLAARLLAAARNGELLASRDVAVSAPEHPWRHHGATRLRGFAEPLDVYALDLVAGVPSEPPGDP